MTGDLILRAIALGGGILLAVTLTLVHLTKRSVSPLAAVAVAALSGALVLLGALPQPGGPLFLLALLTALLGFFAALSS